MIAKKYKVKVSPDELKKAVTIQDIWELMEAKSDNN